MALPDLFRNKNEAAILNLIKHGQISKPQRQSEALGMAAQYQMPEVLLKCLEADFDINGVDSFGDTPLIQACGFGKTSCLKMLLEAGALIDSKGLSNRTAVSKAAKAGKLNEVKLLVKYGADLKGALAAAVEGEYPKVVEFLLTQNVDLEAHGRMQLTPLSIACSSSRKKGPMVAKLLIEAGADVNAMRESDGIMPILFAVNHSEPEVVQMLIDRGANPNQTLKNSGKTALMLASTGNMATVEVLLANGADYFQCEDSGAGPLDVAKEYRYKALVTYYEQRFHST